MIHVDDQSTADAVIGVPNNCQASSSYILVLQNTTTNDHNVAFDQAGNTLLSSNPNVNYWTSCDDHGTTAGTVECKNSYYRLINTQVFLISNFFTVN